MYSHRALIRVFYIAVIFFLFVATVVLVSVIETSLAVYKQAPVTEMQNDELVTPFPVSVNPAFEVILDQDQLHLYPSEQLAVSRDPSWLKRLLTKLERSPWYQNLATPVARTAVVWPGERSEEAAANIGAVLRWNTADKEKFVELIRAQSPVLSEGKVYPGRYTVHRNASPEEVALMIHTKFQNEILSRYTPDVAAQVPLRDALIIASLLEREASDFENMREVSGVIWNRLFIDMPLQLDATLQYARANKNIATSWWPVPAPQDKYISSPFNTYMHEGLPPAPIANPSSDAVLAALNPIATDCLFYFHANDGSYHCSESYEQHVQKLTATFGRGR